MPFQISIQPSGHTLIAEDGASILRAALDAGFVLPYGCRNGACGACKGKILSGQVDFGLPSESALSEQDKAAAWHCSAAPSRSPTSSSRAMS